MSSHCGRYPSCGCTKEIGSKCQLPSEHPRLLDKEVNNPKHDSMLKVLADLNRAINEKPPKNTPNRKNRRAIKRKK